MRIAIYSAEWRGFLTVVLTPYCARPKKSELRGGLFLALCLSAVTARFLYGLLGLDRRHKTETEIVVLHIFDVSLTHIK